MSIENTDVKSQLSEPYFFVRDTNVIVGESVELKVFLEVSCGLLQTSKMIQAATNKSLGITSLSDLNWDFTKVHTISHSVTICLQILFYSLSVGHINGASALYNSTVLRVIYQDQSHEDFGLHLYLLAKNKEHAGKAGVYMLKVSIGFETIVPDSITVLTDAGDFMFKRTHAFYRLSGRGLTNSLRFLVLRNTMSEIPIQLLRYLFGGVRCSKTALMDNDT
ncbi:uncharacterized protein DEA37_0000700 [Paragonimus westermani]|uniref:Uncharacterized protein n=1 Tax=Paragonimus westermani TaxID=34504 RepID=A0A5J4P1T9_9TREM|nr:uncharacterized protein DEA37_0000700 [Paragonimus westermani]